MTDSNPCNEVLTQHQQPQASWPRCLVLCLLFFVLISVLLAVVVLLLFVYLPTATCGPDVCTSRECIEIGAFITQNLNISADPCEDFFQYACGGYVERNRYDGKLIKSGIGAFMDMIKNLHKKIFEVLYLENMATTDDREMAELYNISRAMFHSCMNWHASFWSRSDVLKEFVDPLFAFMTDGIRTNQLNSLEQLLGRLMKVGASNLMKLELTENEYSVILSAESDDKTEFNDTRISIKTDLFGFAKRWSQADVQALIDAMTANNSLDFVAVLQLKTSVNELVRTQNTLFSLIEAASTLSSNDSDDTYCGTVGDLQRSMEPGKFNWSSLLYYAFDRHIDPSFSISVQSATALRKILSNLSRSAQTFRMDSYGPESAFLLFDSVLSYANFFPEHLRQLTGNLKRTVNMQNIDSTREKDLYPKFCVLFVMTSMQPVVVDMYTRAFIKQGFSDIHQIIDDVKQAMVQNVDDEMWISEQGKRSIKSKIRSVKQSVGYDPMSPESIKASFSGVRKMYKKDKGFGHVIALHQAIKARKMALIMTANTTLSYFFMDNPLQVNAFNFMERNTIIFPMGILGPYLYDPKYPIYLRYGGIGTVIGHEIGHSFDDAGHLLTDVGDEGHFWDNTTESEYNNRSKCIMDCYSGMELAKGTMLDGNATLGNNIADILGISSAFRALRNQLERPGAPKLKRLPGVLRQLTPEMMFFVQFAQIWCEKVPPEVYMTRYRTPTHSPPKLRVIGSVKNSREFAEVFGCKPNSKMNPDYKCRLW